MKLDSGVVSVVIPVYRDGKRAVAAAEAMLAQDFPADSRVEVILVDDGSDDDTEIVLAELADRVRIIRLDSNRGRSFARNTGAAACSGEAIIFMDCDCVPVGTRFLESHVSVLASGAVASAGRVTGCGTGFWSRYQADASARRERQHATGSTFSGSSQNIAVRKQAFKGVSGFDPNYRAYGFEDRDLLIRLAALGPVSWNPEAEVRHLDSLGMSEVARKMREVGRFSSRIFSTAHPAAYRSLGYSTLDARLHPWMRFAGRICGPMAVSLAARVDRGRFLERSPYPLAKATAKAISAMAYLAGTCD